MKEGGQGFLALELNFICNKTKLVKWFSGTSFTTEKF